MNLLYRSRNITVRTASITYKLPSINMDIAMANMLAKADHNIIINKNLLVLVHEVVSK